MPAESAPGGACASCDGRYSCRILDKFGKDARPKVGWSLDPFGISASQAVLQSLLGMEAWFFTRINGVDDMKKSKGLEFVWRASSSLPDSDTEIFAHVFESYYCMPLPQYAFDWGENKGAPPPTEKNIMALAEGLAKIAKQRAPWFRTNNVLIPWGCDYAYQNAALMYNSTDWIIDVINAHPEWGVHVSYATPSEYLAAVNASAAADPAVRFPVKPAAESFMPYSDWSGYFTSRPTLKGLNTEAHSALRAAEALYAIGAAGAAPAGGEVHSEPAGAAGNGNGSASETNWGLLETARRNAGIVQHHDAITGTECSYKEGCSGTNQVRGRWARATAQPGSPRRVQCSVPQACRLAPDKVEGLDWYSYT
jgi:hypothetical protein